MEHRDLQAGQGSGCRYAVTAAERHGEQRAEPEEKDPDLVVDLCSCPHLWSGVADSIATGPNQDTSPGIPWEVLVNVGEDAWAA